MRIECILLAAGFSRRFGGNKLFLSAGDEALWQHTCAVLQNVKFKQDIQKGIVVVTQYPAIREECRRRGICCAVNPDPARGISSSLQTGLLAAPGADHYAFFVADQPALTAGAVSGFLNAYLESGAPLGAVCGPEGPGNPCVFSAQFVPQLLALRGDRGGRQILRANLENAFLYPLPPEMLRDVDTPAQAACAGWEMTKEG